MNKPALQLMEASAAEGRGRRQPLYRELMRQVRRRIETGKLRPGTKAPSESDLIAEFRVSSTTARRCLDELADLGLVRRVQGKGTFVAERRASQTQAQIGILYDELVGLAEVFGIRLLRGIARETRESAYGTPLIAIRPVMTTADPAGAMRDLAHLHRLQGLVIASPLPLDLVEPLLDEGVPVASVNFGYDDRRVMSALQDAALAWPRMGSRLRRHGHQRVVTIRRTFEPRMIEGVQLTPALAVEEMGFSGQAETFAYFEPDQTRQIVSRHLASPQPPTAFVAFGYEVALEIRQAVREWGLRVPQDVSVAFIGVPPGPTDLDGELAPIEEMAGWAARAVMDALDGNRVAQKVRTFASTVQVGTSMGPAPEQLRRA